MNRKLISEIILIIMIILMSSNVYAAGYQANKEKTGLLNTTIDDFFKEIRNMEAEGGTLGKTAIISTIDYTDSSKNGIDCHMAKNTEWGTAAMLAASDYGTVPTKKTTTSTTGNESGIYRMADAVYEFVVGIYDNTYTSYNKSINHANSRYKNNYKSLTKYSITGDGILETDKWYSASYNSFFTSAESSMISRGVQALFAYITTAGDASKLYTSRAVVVCGANL